MIKMSTIDEIKQAGQEITDKLVEIREGIGAPLKEGVFKPGGHITIKGAEILKRAQKHPNEPIIINGKCSRVYIRDHSFNKWLQGLAIGTNCFTDGNKVHFYYCSTLQKMTDIGREKRYHVQDRPGNKYAVDFSNKKNAIVRLAWCQICLKVMASKSQIYLPWSDCPAIASRGDAKECIDCVEALYNRKEPFDVIQQKVRSFLYTY